MAAWLLFRLGSAGRQTANCGRLAGRGGGPTCESTALLGVACLLRMVANATSQELSTVNTRLIFRPRRPTPFPFRAIPSHYSPREIGCFSWLSREVDKRIALFFNQLNPRYLTCLPDQLITSQSSSYRAKFLQFSVSYGAIMVTEQATIRSARLRHHFLASRSSTSISDSASGVPASIFL